jgi:type I restriction enzyme S subunit
MGVETINRNVCKSFKSEKLSNLFVLIRNGISLKQKEGASGIPVTRIETISNQIINQDKMGYADINDDNFSDYYLQNGDILMSHINSLAHLGKSAIVNNLNKKIIHGMNLLLLRANERLIHNQYVWHYFNSSSFKQDVIKISNQSVNQSSFSLNKLKELEIPLPPLPVQKRIVEILDTADTLRRKDQELLKKYDELAQAIFIDMFGDPVKNEKRWEIKKLKDLGSLDRGISKHRPRNAPELLGGIYPLIQTGDVANSGGVITQYHSTYSEIGLKQSKIWSKGTLCITIAANIAKTGILDFDACFPDSIVGFKAFEKVSNAVFVQFWIGFLQKILEDNAPESAQKNINLGILRELNVIYPPFKLQAEFESRIQLLSNIKNHSNFTNIGNLFNSLLQKAFKGELLS